MVDGQIESGTLQSAIDLQSEIYDLRSSPVEFQPQLNLARGPRGENLAEAVRRRAARCGGRECARVVDTSDVRVRQPLALIEGIDEFGAELQARRPREIEILRQVDVPLVAARLAERRAARVAERA